MVRTMKGLLVLGALAVMATGTAQAQPAPTAGCTNAKIKCVVNKQKGLFGCNGKAQKLGVAVDPACVTKVTGKFTTPATGCMDKADIKFAGALCQTHNDAAAIEAKTDAFVDDIVTDEYSGSGVNLCAGAKEKCVTNYVKGQLGCISKARKLGVAVDPLCVSKVSGKFNTPATGCMQKADIKFGAACTVPGDAAAIQAKADAFINDANAELGFDNTMTLTTTAGAGACGSLDSAGGALVSLDCGKLYIGGGASTVPGGATPAGSTTKFTVVGTALHGANSVITGSNRTCSEAGCFFGSPLPIANGGLSTCVVNTFATFASGTINQGAGTLTGAIPLSSQTTVTGNATEPCPKCVAGACDAAAANPGAACTADAASGESHDCQANGTTLPAFAVNLSPIGTGSSNATAASGLFCPGQNNAGAFGQPTAVSITETGSPEPGINGGSVTLASVFCIPSTGNVLIDGAADLPGPGGIALVGTLNIP